MNGERVRGRGSRCSIFFLLISSVAMRNVVSKTLCNRQNSKTITKDPHPCIIPSP